jgi:hypothetical protein
LPTEAVAETVINPLLWLVPLFPLLGYLFIAVAGRKLTGAPLPVVEAGHEHAHDVHGHSIPATPAAPTTHAVAQNVGGSDAPEFVADPGTVSEGAANVAATHPDTKAHADDDHGHGHGGGHDDHSHGAHLNAGGTRLIGAIATLLVFGSFLVSLLLFFQVLGMQGEERRIFSPSFDWMRVPAMAGMPGLDLKFQLAVDPLTALMLLIITGIGALITCTRPAT